MPQRLPRFQRYQEAIEDERRLAKILLESDASLEDVEGPRLVNGAAGGDRRRMRGLSIVARGISGTAPHTDPLGALLAKERRNRR